jgi:hypothetical protein
MLSEQVLIVISRGLLTIQDEAMRLPASENTVRSGSEKDNGKSQVRKGFRDQRMIVVTTLLDAKRYSAQQLTLLYGLRWQAAEVHWSLD